MSEADDLRAMYTALLTQSDALYATRPLVQQVLHTIESDGLTDRVLLDREQLTVNLISALVALEVRLNRLEASAQPESA